VKLRNVARQAPSFGAFDICPVRRASWGDGRLSAGASPLGYGHAPRIRRHLRHPPAHRRTPREGRASHHKRIGWGDADPAAAKALDVHLFRLCRRSCDVSAVTGCEGTHPRWRVQRGDDLDQRHDGNLVEEVKADDRRRPSGRRRKPGDGDRGSVAGRHRPRVGDHREITGDRDSGQGMRALFRGDGAAL
jgi:hypothetical protein